MHCGNYVQGKHIRWSGSPKSRRWEVPGRIFLYSRGGRSSRQLVPHCRHSLVCSLGKRCIAVLSNRATAATSYSTAVHPRRTFKRAAGSSRRSFVPLTDLLLAANCLRTAPTGIGMPLVDSWNHFDSPLGKAECVLTP